MELKTLAGLGKVAGIGGIALGVLLLLLRDVLASKVLAGLPPEQALQLLWAIVIGAFVIGALGIVAWMLAQRGPAQPNGISASGGSVAMGDHAQGNRINITHTGGTGSTGGKPAPKRNV